MIHFIYSPIQNDGGSPGELKYRFAISILINVLADSVITNDINATFNAASFHFLFVCKIKCGGVR